MDKQQNRNQAHLPYRIIALDLDGTLTNHDKVITLRATTKFRTVGTLCSASSALIVALSIHVVFHFYNVLTFR